MRRAGGLTTALALVVSLLAAAPATAAGPEAEPRIVGGGPSTLGDWPFMAALVFKPSGNQFCGGTVIAPTWVLSAGHCVTTFGTSTIDIAPADLEIPHELLKVSARSEERNGEFTERSAEVGVKLHG